MTEVRAVAQRLGIEFRLHRSTNGPGAEKVGQHKTSMLQDLERAGVRWSWRSSRGRVELGGRVDVAMPATRAGTLVRNCSIGSEL